MGIDFYAYSNIIKLQIPYWYQAECINEYYIVSKCATQWEEELMDNNGIHVDWKNNNYYIKSDTTEETRCGRSYTGYGEFIQQCNTYLGHKIAYNMKENINTDLEKLTALINELETIHNDFKNNEEHYWFYNDFYIMLTVAIKNGCVVVS